MHVHVIVQFLKTAPQEQEMRKREGQSDRKCVKNDSCRAVGQFNPTSKTLRPNTSFGFVEHTEASSFFQERIHFQNPR